MIRRILFTTAAAATLLASAPALAADRAEPGKDQPCSCCSDGSVHHHDHDLRTQGARPDRAAQPGQAEDPDTRNQSFGG